MCCARQGAVCPPQGHEAQQLECDTERQHHNAVRPDGDVLKGVPLRREGPSGGHCGPPPLPSKAIPSDQNINPNPAVPAKIVRRRSSN